MPGRRGSMRIGREPGARLRASPDDAHARPPRPWLRSERGPLDSDSRRP